MYILDVLLILIWVTAAKAEEVIVPGVAEGGTTLVGVAALQLFEFRPVRDPPTKPP